MELYLLKSGACLVLCFVFYKLFLEKTSLHSFKRFYLLLGLAASFIIPLITFTIYVDPYPVVSELTTFTTIPSEMLVVEQEASFNWTTLIWCIYGLGATLFGLRFLFHLLKISERIHKNPKQKEDKITNVLVPQNVAPHTFFNFIFFNKKAFESGEIPKEVVTHEQAHAKQKHSLDIVLIETLHVVFWFNPLLYFIKKAMKLNHEFLADQQVLKQGVALNAYQNILLAFSSNAATPQLAHSIHYSSIKKRFTVMKTHTSKSVASIKMLLIVPLLAVLVYGFSTTQEIERENNFDTLEQSSLAPEERLTARSIAIEILEDQQLLVEGIKTTRQQLYSALGSLNTDITKKQRDRIINIHVSSQRAIAYEDLVYIQKVATVYGYHRIVTPNEEIIRSKGNVPAVPKVQISSHKDDAKEFMLGAEKNGIKTFVLQIELNELRLNGRLVPLDNLSNSINKITKDWEETDYKSAKPSILIASVQHDFLIKANKEFKKTHFSKANEGLSFYSFLPPPPTSNSNKQKGPNNGKELSTNYISNTGNIIKKPIGSSNLLYTPRKQFKGLSQKNLPKYQPNLRYYYKGTLTSLTEVRNLLEDNQDLEINVNKETNTAIVKIVTRSTPPPPPPSQDLGAITQKYKYSVVLYVNGRDIYVHGKKTSLGSFAKTLDAHTKDWPDDAYKLYGVSVQLDEISKGFVDKINQEYRKTKLARMSSSKSPYIIGPEDLPPPPPPSKLLGDVTQKYDYSIVLYVNGRDIYVHGKKTSLNAFAKTLDAHTKDWPDEAYKFYGVSVKLDRIYKGFADQINQEYRKTKLARMSSSKNPYIIGPKDVPPPPPPPTVLKGEASQLPPPPPPTVLKGEASQLPPPPPPPSKLDHIITMAKKDATFYYEGNIITSDKAIDLVKNNQNLNMNSQNNNGVATVHLSKNGSTVINNKQVNKADCISLKEVKKLKADTQISGCVTINKQPHYYLKEGKAISYYNRWGNAVNEKGEKLQ